MLRGNSWIIDGIDECVLLLLLLLLFVVVVVVVVVAAAAAAHWFAYSSYLSAVNFSRSEA